MVPTKNLIPKHKTDIYMRQRWNDHRFNLTEFTNQTARVEESALDTLWMQTCFSPLGWVVQDSI